MKIYLDCEGCVYNMLEAIKRRNPKFRPSGVKQYNFKDCDLGIERSEVLKYLGELETFQREPLYKGAQEGIRQLMRIGTVVGYTTVPESVADYRKWQLKKLGITNMAIYIGDKPYMTDADVVIDDCPDVLSMYDSSKTLKIMITHPYNTMYMDAYPAKNLIEAVGTIRSVIGK